MKKKLFWFCCAACIFLFLLGISGCRKFVKVETPPDNLSQENVFSTDQTAISVLTGIYTELSRSGVNMTEICGLLGDEFLLWSGSDLPYTAYYANSLESNQSRNTGQDIWNLYYNYIFRCNAVLEGLAGNNSISAAVKKQLLGETHFLRAWFYFYLVNLYGELPLPLYTDPEANRLLPRSSIRDVFNLIIRDLHKASEFLNTEYVDGQLKPYGNNLSERVRPTIWASIALLARAHLYLQEYDKAEAEASKIIEQSVLFSLIPLGDIFLKNSMEAIWQLPAVDVGWNTMEARRFHLLAFPAGLSFDKPFHLNPVLIDAFEPNDLRRTQWVDSLREGTDIYYFPVKYKIGEENPNITSSDALTEYSTILRLSEIYLIRSEARARQNNLEGAMADLDVIRKRSNLPMIVDINPGISQGLLLNVILHERQVELFSEYGHRWFDLKRSGKVDQVMNIVTPNKGGTWETTDQLLPIPYEDLIRNPKLVQNMGY